jgi:hypothetical protein
MKSAPCLYIPGKTGSAPFLQAMLVCSLPLDQYQLMQNPIQSAVAEDLPPFGGGEYSILLILPQFAGFVRADFPAKKDEKLSLILNAAARYARHATCS